MRRLLACLFFWLAVWLSTGCAYKLRHQQAAHRTEQETRQSQTAETAESQTQSVATETKKGSRETRRFTPEGKLVEQVLEQWGSDGRVETEAVSASQSTAVASASKSVASSSNSTRASDTRVGVNPWWWLLLLVPVGVAGWLLRKWIRSRIPFL